MVELAPFSDSTLVAQAVASAVNIHEEVGATLLRTIVKTLRSKSLLLLLDNCEHLLAACAELSAALLRECPQVKLLATSRERLGIAGEQTYRVPSLSLPDLDAPMSVEGISRYESVRLFAARASLIRSDFEVTPQNAQAMAHICRRLDGIPLAIELAAAWVRSMSVENLRARLDDRFDMLAGGDRSALPRQQTLRNLIDWSYDLLSAQEKLLLQQLSVFAGGWTLEAAEAVCRIDGEAPHFVSGQAGRWEGGGTAERAMALTNLNSPSPLPSPTKRRGDTELSLGPATYDLRPDEVLDLLTALVDKSLVIAEESGGSVRYRLLDTVRQYAWDRLAKSGVTYAVRARHVDHYLAFAEDAAPRLQGEEISLLLGILEAEHDNMRQALRFCREEDKGVEKGLRLASALERFWSTRGYLGEGREHFRFLLNHPAALKHPKPRADALSGAGALAHYQGAYSTARSLHEESLSIRREVGDRAGTAASLRSVGSAALALKDYASANSLLHESLAIHQELGDKRAIAQCLLSLGAMAAEQGQLTSARSYNEMSLKTYRELRNKRGISSSLFNLGAIAQEECDYRSARAMYDEVLAIRRELGDKGGISSSLNNLANLSFELRDYETARSLYEQSMKIRVELSHRPGIASSLGSLGKVACEQGDYASACARYDEAAAIWRELGEKRNVSECLLKLGNAAIQLGHFDSARYSYRESLGICRELGDTPGITGALEALAALSANEGGNERAAMLWGAAAAVRKTSGAPQPPDQQNLYEASVRDVRYTLGDNAFEAAWAIGSAMTLEDTITLALGRSES
jgi:predicted ATPase